MDSSRAGRDTYISCPPSEVRKLKPRKVKGLSQGMSQVCSLFGGPEVALPLIYTNGGMMQADSSNNLAFLKKKSRSNQTLGRAQDGPWVVCRSAWSDTGTCASGVLPALDPFPFPFQQIFLEHLLWATC